MFTSAHPRQGLEWRVRSPGGPRLLGIGELEALRDELAARLEDTRQTLRDRTRVERRNVERIEEMVAAPERFKWVRISNEDIGEPGVQALAFAPALRPDRHADGLVAGQDLLRLSMTTGARRALRDPVPGPRWPIGAGATPADYRRPGTPAEAPSAGIGGRPAADEAASGDRRARRPPARAPAGAVGPVPPGRAGASCSASVLLIAGFFVQGTRGITMIAAGVALASLAGLELSIREHLAGYRSHSTVLAGVATVVALAAGFFVLPTSLLVVNLLIGAVVFGVCFYALREVFKRRSGGLGFR